MIFTQELQQLLLVHSLPPTSMETVAFLEAALHSNLVGLLDRLKYAVKRLDSAAAQLSATSSSSSTSGTSGPAGPSASGSTTSSTSTSASTSTSSHRPYDILLLLLHTHDKPRFYRLAQYLNLEETRRKAKESAYGVSELEMPNEDDEPDRDPEDAWCKSEASKGGNAPFSTSATDALMPQDVLSLFEEFAEPTPAAPDADSNEAWQSKARATPGLVEHFKKLRALDLTTVNMQPSDYVQFSETRAQASFSHHRTRAKRFQEFIGTELAALDIPVTDDLLDVLGFIAFDMVSDMMDRAAGRARTRVALLKAAEKRTAAKKAKAPPKNGSTSGFKPPKGTKSGRGAAATIKSAAGKKSKKKKPKAESAASARQTKADKDKEAEAKRREINLNPVGPFSAPPMQQASLGNLAGASSSSTGQGGSGSAGANAASESVKVDNPTVGADIVSGYDVLVGDFEAVFHGARRRGPALLRGRGLRPCDRFAR